METMQRYEETDGSALDRGINNWSRGLTSFQESADHCRVRGRHRQQEVFCLRRKKEKKVISPVGPIAVPQARAPHIDQIL